MSDPDSLREHDRITALAHKLEVALASIRNGEFGGLDFRGGYCLLYCYGSNAGVVYEAISPAIAEFGPEPGSWAIKRFGAATDVNARRERVDLHSI